MSVADLRSFVFLSGGTGTPKLLQGFRNLISDNEISVICNTGDDFIWNGLHISPDLDTILYLFSSKLDTKKFWGVTDDAFSTLEVLKTLEAQDTWFNVGDKDLGLHLFRSNKLNSMTLTQITQEICKNWKIRANILPMSNVMVQSRIKTPEGELGFQEFFVKYHTQPKVLGVSFIGDTSNTTNEILKVIDEANAIIIGPSNPVTSIGPILAVKSIYNKLHDNRNKVIIVSPIVGENAFSGPTIKLMNAQKIEPSIVGLANLYKDISSTIVIDTSDSDVMPTLENLGYKVISTPIEMKTDEQKQNLARTILGFI